MLDGKPENNRRMANWTERDLAAWEKRKARSAGKPITRINSRPIVRELSTSDDISKSKRGSLGRRADLGGMFLRSRWEANIARYLNWLKMSRAVIRWEYETEEFEFPVKRGNRFYKIDFKIWFAKEPDTPVYWEVKGYLDDDSRVKLNRMARHYPDVHIEVIGEKEYAAIRRQCRGFIPNWE
jgi:hypothetical protein